MKNKMKISDVEKSKKQFLFLLFVLPWFVMLLNIIYIFWFSRLFLNYQLACDVALRWKDWNETYIKRIKWKKKQRNTERNIKKFSLLHENVFKQLIKFRLIWRLNNIVWCYGCTHNVGFISTTKKLNTFIFCLLLDHEKGQRNR